MIQKSRIVRAMPNVTPAPFFESEPLARRRAASELEARDLGKRILEQARSERAEEERAFQALLGASKRKAIAEAQRAAKDDLVALAGLVAERLVGDVVAQSQAALVAIVEDVLREARPLTSATVRVCSASAPVVRAACAEGSESALGGGALTVVEDDSLSPGDVIVESEEGCVDGRVTVRLAALLRVLSRAWRR